MVLEEDKKKAQAKENETDFKSIEMNRSCTDIACCVIFLAFIASMVGITGYSIKNGNPMAMITPFDSSGNRCGMPLQGSTKLFDFTDYKYKFMYNLQVIAEDAAAKSFDPKAAFKS